MSTVNPFDKALQSLGGGAGTTATDVGFVRKNIPEGRVKLVIFDASNITEYEEINTDFMFQFTNKFGTKRVLMAGAWLSVQEKGKETEKKLAEPYVQILQMPPTVAMSIMALAKSGSKFEEEDFLGNNIVYTLNEDSPFFFTGDVYPITITRENGATMQDVKYTVMAGSKPLTEEEKEFCIKALEHAQKNNWKLSIGSAKWRGEGVPESNSDDTPYEAPDF